LAKRAVFETVGKPKCWFEPSPVNNIKSVKENGHHYGFNIRALYYDEPTPKIRMGFTTEDVLWNAITLYYHEYSEELEEMKKTLSGSNHFMAPYVSNCINFVHNEMAAFCNVHKVPNPRPSKKGEMMPLPIDEYPIWFNNLEDFIADITWGKKDRKIMVDEVLPKMLNEFVVYDDVIKVVDFSVKNPSEMEAVIDDVILKFPDKVAAYKNGKIGLINMLFGEVVKNTKGRINVAEARKNLEIRLRDK
jgi:Asp-tRNA(Asn)/Glu-tRNA(Gln) amidotransferase B subunit